MTKPFMGGAIPMPFMDSAVPMRFVPSLGYMPEPNAEARWTNGYDFQTVSRANRRGFLDREPPSADRARQRATASSTGSTTWPRRGASPVISQRAWIERRGEHHRDARWTHDAHRTPTGHRWAAEALLEWLARNQDVCLRGLPHPDTRCRPAP